MTGKALVRTRLSRVAMNIGSDAATIATQSGTRRRSGAASTRSTGTTSTGTVESTGEMTDEVVMRSGLLRRH